MTENTSIINKFNDFISSDTKGSEIGICAIAGSFFGYAFYKIRPLTKFGRAFDIPKHFIVNRQPQNGTILSIEPHLSEGPLLKVNHKAPLNVLVFSKKTLPVKLFGIQINANGFAWLQSVAVNKNIQFVPLKAHSDYAECKMVLLGNGKFKRNLDLIECLTRLGFAQVVRTPSSCKEKDLMNYIAKLEKAQNKAKRERAGFWSFSISPPPWPVKVAKNLADKIVLYILPKRYRLPELVR